jgi:hypothetical protein
MKRSVLAFASVLNIQRRPTNDGIQNPGVMLVL